MIYQEAINYIHNIERAGSDYGIERMRELLTLLDEPDRRLKFVHIAGTNGKGSVSAYMTSILKEAGYKVGTYNSPSVFEYNERWLIDGAPLSDELVAKYLTIVKDTVDAEQKLRDAFELDRFCPTAFEIETAVAFLAFFEAECDICVLETGLGGRWDATNVVCEKELAIITPIGLDHCDLLGNTLKEIASEKGAIIKGDAITVSQCDEIMQELKHPYLIEGDKKTYQNCNLHIASKPVIVSDDVSGQVFEVDGRQFEIGMLGAHQAENASIAIKAVEVLNKKHWDISDDAICKGLKKARWGARFEIVENAQSRFNLVIPSGKTLVFDGSHNPHGAKTLVAGLAKYFENARIHFVFGIFKDKDVDGVVKLIAPLANKVSAVTAPSVRAERKEALKGRFDKVGVDCDTFNNIHQAVQNALDGDCDVVVLCGSLSLFANLKKDKNKTNY